MPDAMRTLRPQTALLGTTPRISTFGPVRIEENADLALASLSKRHGQNTPEPFGMILPAIGKAVKSGPFGAFWIGQGQWMITADGLGDAGLAKALKTETPDVSVTEQTDGFAVFEILSHTNARLLDRLITKLVNVDPKTLTSGTAARTGLNHMTVFLIRNTDVHFTVIGMRSLAGSLWHAVTVAAARLENEK